MELITPKSKGKTPFMVVIEGQSPPVSSYLPGLGLGAGRRWRVALEQYREMVIMRIVTFTGFGNCFGYPGKKNDSCRSANRKL